MSIIRGDFIFSYWIFAWFILYTCNLTSFSPKFILILGLIYNSLILFVMLMNKTRKRKIVNFIIVNTLIKGLPLYYLRNETIQLKNILFSIFLFIIFIIWLYINNQTITGNAKMLYESIVYGINKTPLISVLEEK